MTDAMKMFYCIHKDAPSEIVLIVPEKVVSLEEMELSDGPDGEARKMAVLTADDGEKYIPLALMDEVQGKANAEILEQLLRQAKAAQSRVQN